MRSSEEIENQIGLFEMMMMKRERRDFGVAPGMTCIICSKTYEESPETLINILRHTYCKICIKEKLQSKEADEFILCVLTGSVYATLINKGDDTSEKTSSHDSQNENVVLETSVGVPSLPRGFIYPNNRKMQKVADGGAIGSKKVPYSSLRMNAQPPSHSTYPKKQKSETRKRKAAVDIISETSSVDSTWRSTGRKKKNSCNEDWPPQQGKGKNLQHETSDDQDSESVNKP